jgi:hypothetical protein
MTKPTQNDNISAPGDSQATEPFDLLDQSVISVEPSLHQLDGQDDVIAALTAMTPADMNMELMLDHLTASNDLFSSPHLDLSVLANSISADDQG